VGILLGYLWLVNPPLAPIALLPLAVIYIAFKNFIRLQEVDRLKANFITEVSHELRTPLSAILASSELLYHHGDRLDIENVREISRSSYESSNHLVRLPPRSNRELSI
jgi:signal transduction histidine kinase